MLSILKHVHQLSSFAIRIPGHLDELGGDETGGTVVGGEGLVQLGHDPAAVDVLLHQIDFIAGCGTGRLRACCLPKRPP